MARSSAACAAALLVMMACCASVQPARAVRRPRTIDLDKLRKQYKEDEVRAGASRAAALRAAEAHTLGPAHRGSPALASFARRMVRRKNRTTGTRIRGSGRTR